MRQQHEHLFSSQKDQFMEFFNQYYKSHPNLQASSVREVAQKLANKYFTAQLKSHISTENKQQKPKRRIINYSVPTKAILQAKQKFQARQLKQEQTQKKLPLVSLKRQKSRSFSMQQTLTSRHNLVTESKFTSEGVPQKFVFWLGEGNNDQLIKQLLIARGNWIQANDPQQKNINLKWQETEKGYEFRTLVVRSKECQQTLFNHFEFHSQISNKFLLALNIEQYCQKHSLNQHQFIPTTFTIETNQQSIKQQLSQFASCLHANAPDSLLNEIDKDIQKNYIKYQNQQDSLQSQYPTLYSNKYLWIFKPSNMNQGRGIHLVKTVSEVIELLHRYQNGYRENLLEVKRNQNNEIINKVIYLNTLSDDHFVIQKYIEKPLLIDGRKFDVRVYVLLTMNLSLYFYKEGQIRLATEPFQLSKINNYIHLTNNAVQYNHPEYGKKEEGNQLTFDQASIYFKMDFRKQVINDIKERSHVVVSTVKNKINKYKRKFCFEIFGFDYILDENFKPWLIEVNTNPSLEVTSKLLDALFPRMVGKKENLSLDDAFKLTVDKLFSPQKQDTKYQLMNYMDEENLWECLGPLLN